METCQDEPGSNCHILKEFCQHNTYGQKVNNFVFLRIAKSGHFAVKLDIWSKIIALLKLAILGKEHNVGHQTNFS